MLLTAIARPPEYPAEDFLFYGIPHPSDTWKYELLSCPFCATAAEWVSMPPSRTRRVFQVRCAPCSTQRGFGVQTPCVTTAAEAASLWNYRVAPILAGITPQRMDQYARWRPMQNGIQLDTPLWTVAFIGLTGLEDPAERWHWHVHGSGSGGRCPHGQEGLREVRAVVPNDLRMRYLTHEPGTADSYLKHLLFEVVLNPSTAAIVSPANP